MLPLPSPTIFPKLRVGGSPRLPLFFLTIWESCSKKKTMVRQTYYNSFPTIGAMIIIGILLYPTTKIEVDFGPAHMCHIIPRSYLGTGHRSGRDDLVAIATDLRAGGCMLRSKQQLCSGYPVVWGWQPKDFGCFCGVHCPPSHMEESQGTDHRPTSSSVAIELGCHSNDLQSN